VWELDPANGRDLIDRPRPHARRFTLKTAQVGEGWRPLVEECHERPQAAFPDYELLAVKQTYRALECQACSATPATSVPQTLPTRSTALPSYSTTGFTRAGQTRSAVGLLSPSVPQLPCRGALFTLRWSIRRVTAIDPARTANRRTAPLTWSR
jgi:hypothetical protein